MFRVLITLTSPHFTKEPSTDFILTWKKDMINGMACFGVFVTSVEVFCFVSLFYHIYKHNKNVALGILGPSVVKHRNRTNAITMTGQVIFLSILKSYV